MQNEYSNKAMKSPRAKQNRFFPHCEKTVLASSKEEAEKMISKKEKKPTAKQIKSKTDEDKKDS